MVFGVFFNLQKKAPNQQRRPPGSPGKQHRFGRTWPEFWCFTMGGQLSSPTPNLESGQFSGKGDGKGLLMEEIRPTRQLRLVVFPGGAGFLPLRGWRLCF